MKILIVDDNSDDRRLLRYIAERHGHEVIEAVDGLDGLRFAKLNRPDLVISDALMPVMDGFQFLRQFREDETLARTPFIFYSATYRGDRDVDLALALGADAYIIKPKEPIELWDEVELILQEGGREKVITPEIIKEDEEYLRRYSQVVATRLEENMRELREAKERLERSESFTRKILDSVEEGFVVIDSQYRIVSANRAFCEMAKLPEEKIKDRLCYEISHGSAKPCFESGEECPVRRTFDTGVPHSASHAHIDASGAKLYVELKSYPVFDETGAIASVIETVNEVTEKRRLEEQLIQAQKMEAIGTLAGGVAHDFNNILTAILGYGEIMKMTMRPDDSQRAYLEQIMSSASRAADLTRGLLAFSRKQVLNPRPVEINSIVQNVEKLLRRLIGEHIDLVTDLSPEGLIVMADAGQVEQVLMNLSTNARDAMPNGGVLTISTKGVDLNEVSGAVFGSKPGRYALVSVFDTGCGMDEVTREKIFEPFFTTKETGKGTGLGMAIVYGIVKQHEGAINMISEPGEGTTVEIFFPLITPHKEDSIEVEASLPSGGTETVLLAEDDRTVREMMTFILTTAGYRVITAADGQEAVDKFREHSGEIDIVIIDFIMPRKNGPAVCDEIRTVEPSVKVLFTSGYPAETLRLDELGHVDVPLVIKPLMPEALLRAVRTRLDGKTEEA